MTYLRMTHPNDLRDRIEIRRLMIALTGGFDVNSRPFNRAFCDCLAADVGDRPDDVVPFELTISRIRDQLAVSYLFVH